MDASTALALATGFVLAAAVAAVALRHLRVQAATDRAALLAEVEAQRAIDRQATADALRSVVAEQGGTVEAAVQTVLAVAHDKLGDQAVASTQALDLRQHAIDQQVQAFTGELREMRELVQSLKQQGANQHGELSQALADAAERNTVLHQTTDELRRALASPKARGQWGERMADDVLRACGLREGLNYRKQKALAGGTIPDVTFFMPRGLLLNMDVKFPIDNYLKFLEAETSADAERLRAQFLRDVRGRVKELTSRDYIDPERTVDCVLLFIPNESVYSFIHESDASVADLALEHKVVLCSPFTLLGVLGVVRQAMDNFLLERTSDEILQCLTGLTHEWTKFNEQLEKVGRAVESAQKSYDVLAGTRRRAFEKRLDQIDAVRERRGLNTEGELDELGSIAGADDITVGDFTCDGAAPAALPPVPELPDIPMPVSALQLGDVRILREVRAG